MEKTSGLETDPTTEAKPAELENELQSSIDATDQASQGSKDPNFNPSLPLGTDMLAPPGMGTDTNHNPNLQEDLAMTVLSTSTQNKTMKLVAENLEATRLLIESMNSGTNETRCSAATDLLTLLTPDFEDNLIGSSGAIQGAVKLLLDMSVEGGPLPMKDVASAIFGLCSVVENREEAVHAGAVRVIWKMIKKQTPPVEEFLAILALLSRVKSAAKEMLELEAVPLLLDIIRKDTSEGCNKHSLEILYRICWYDMTVSRVLRDEQFKHETLSNVKGFADHPLFILCLLPTIPEDWQTQLAHLDPGPLRLRVWI